MATSTSQELVAYQHSVDEVVATLDSDSRNGLSTQEAQARLEQFGPNELEAEKPTPAWRRFLAQFEDVLVILLLIATAISVGLWLYEQDTPLPYEGLAIFAIVLLNGILGYVQEARAEKAVAALRAMAADTATVIRDGERQNVLATELVPGDIILIEEGDTIPADGRIVQSVALQTMEASLTGESMPISKEIKPLPEEAGVGDRVNMLFSSTAATYGRGKAIVTATGMQSEMGKIAGLLQTTETETTPLQQELNRTGKVLGLVVLVIAAIIVAVILLVEQVTEFAMIIEVLILGVALAVAAVPEGLPAVVTAVLALGVQRMARRSAIVRRLPAVETLGSATVVASDKTGTLTKNEMTARTVVTASGRTDVTGTGYQPEGELRLDGHTVQKNPVLHAEVERVLRAADLANNSMLQHQDGRWLIQGDPTEGALVVAARKAGLEPESLNARFERVGEVPFSSERKLMSTVHKDARKQERLIVFSKGAPDILLERCTHELIGEESRPLTEARREELHRINEQLAEEALRTLGLAFRSLPRNALDQPLDDRVEQELVFLGLVGMIDPPRSEVKQAVARARNAGIRPIMITGDHPKTAIAIANELDITQNDRAIIGAELSRMDDAALDAAVREVSVYARVNPEHKLRIVQSLQRHDEVVAMTGDGVNDAPALKTANIGVAMGITGTDVSKEAADMVLADDNFATIVAAVEEGRSIFANIQKFLRFLLSSNAGEVLTMFFGVLFAGVIGLTQETELLVLPLLTTQILWINLVTDGLPALALGLDPADPTVMDRPPRPQSSGVINVPMWRCIGFVGLVMAIGTLFVLDAALPGGLIPGYKDLTHAQTMAFTTLVLFQLFNVFNARSDHQSAFRDLFTNRWLWGSIAVSLLLQIIVIYTPFLQRAFYTTPLTLAEWLLCFVVASSVLWLRELTKLVGL